MSVRITQGMMFSRALADVQRGLARSSVLQQQIATGRRVLRPSDDPAATLQMAPLRSDIADLRRMSENVSLARETLNTGASALEDASTLFQRVRELTTQASNGTLSQGDRASIAAEVDQLLGQLVGIANSKRGGRYLFGGTDDDQPPFESVTVGGRTSVRYRGNRETLSINVAPGVQTELNVAGDRVFLARNRGSMLITPMPGTTATGVLGTTGGSTAVGRQRLEVTWGGLTNDRPATVSAGNGATTALGQLSYAFDPVAGTLSIGGGAAVGIPVTNGTFTTADDRTISLTVTGVPATLTGTFTSAARLSTDGGVSFTTVTDFSLSAVAVRSATDNSTTYFDARGITRTGVEEIEHVGTFDAFTTLTTLRDLLRNDEGLADGEVQARVSRMLDAVDGAHEAVLNGLREIGFRSSSMDALKNRVEDLQASRQESLSRLEDTDITSAILEMQQQDMSYQAALQISARVIQNSLMGFLR
ncbi:MAG: flagellar hook-associated protein 3 [Planctomycetes bacterium]|nr:flagellar hook-associated protein 3 [Planctomycetota bacterium]